MGAAEGTRRRQHRTVTKLAWLSPCSEFRKFIAFFLVIVNQNFRR